MSQHVASSRSPIEWPRRASFEAGPVDELRYQLGVAVDLEIMHSVTAVKRQDHVARVRGNDRRRLDIAVHVTLEYPHTERPEVKEPRAAWPGLQDDRGRFIGPRTVGRQRYRDELVDAVCGDRLRQRQTVTRGLLGVERVDRGFLNLVTGYRR